METKLCRMDGKIVIFTARHLTAGYRAVTESVREDQNERFSMSIDRENRSMGLTLTHGPAFFT